MATKAQMLEALAAESGPITISSLAEKIGAQVTQITAQVTRMVKNGEMERNEAGEVLITEKGRDLITIPSEVEVGATDFDHFKYLGKKIGVVGDLIDVTADHVWAGGDFHDLTWVWNALGEMNIRQDLKQRWWNAWRSYLKQRVPPELKDEVSASTEALAKEEGSPLKKTERDYIIVDDEPVRVGEGLGDFSLQDAKDILNIRALRDRARGSSTIDRRADAAHGENVSEIITALQPFLTKDTDTGMLKEMLGDKMQILKSEILAGMPQSAGQPKSFMEQITDFASFLGRLKEVGPTLRSILGIPEGGGNPHPASPVTLPFMDKDGHPMTITADPETGIKWLKFLGEEKRADEKQGMLRGMVETFKEEWPTAIGALKEVAEGYNKKAGQRTRGTEAASTEETGPPGEAAGPSEATCPNCQQPFPVTGISPEADIICPHCDAVLTLG